MVSNLGLKEKLYQQCYEFIEARFQVVQNTINEIQESLTSETKSSAGDKHETGRAMLQLEREKAGSQLAEIQQVKQTLSKINMTKAYKNVGLGSIVYTSKHHYFIAISAGELKVDNALFYAISPNAPIGQLLMGKTIGDQVMFRGQNFKIESII